MMNITPEEIRNLRMDGFPVAEIAEIAGVSRSRVYQILGARENAFRRIPDDMNIYPNWRRWMNENKVSPRGFVTRMGLDESSTNYNSLNGWMRGRCYPQKKNIDRILQTTGLTYEQLFSLE